MIGPACPLSRRETVLLAAVALVALAVVMHFFDRFWLPADEGVYAYVAERIIDGDVPYRDVQDLHAGYVQLVNAAAFALMGIDLVSLRYPLALATVLQAVLVFVLLRSSGLLVAVSGGLAAAALTFIQFLNPTANWYALFVAVLATMALASPSRSAWRVVAIGFLLGALFLVRQLTGVLFAMGALTYLLLEAHAAAPAFARRAVLARSLIAVMALGLAGYLVAKVEMFAALLYGLWPLLILAWALTHLRPPDRAVARLIGWLLSGSLLAAAPLLVYVCVNGAFSAWLRDSFITANRLSRLDFLSTPGYLDLLELAAGNVRHPVNAVAAANGLFWVCLVLAPPVVGILTLRYLSQVMRRPSPRPVHPLPITVPFFALVSVHYQIPIYLFFSAAPLLWALLWHAGERSAFARSTAAATVLALSVVGLLWQAGQPLSRGWAGVVSGRTVALAATGTLPKASLRMETEDYDTYRSLLAAINRYAGPADRLLTAPQNPELYFLSGRRPPVKFFSTAIGLRGEGDVRDAAAVLRADPPAVIVRRPADKYNTTLGDALLASVLVDYERVETVADFEVWALSRRLGGVAKDVQRAAAQP